MQHKFHISKYVTHNSQVDARGLTLTTHTPPTKRTQTLRVKSQDQPLFQNQKQLSSFKCDC